MATVTVGTEVTADLLELMNNPPLVRLVQASAQSIPSGVATALTFGTGSTELDTHNFHSESSNNSRVTPSIAGYYEASVTYTSSASTTMTRMYTGIAKNGALVQPVNVIPRDATNSISSSNATAIVSCNGSTDYIEGMANQSDSGSAARNTQASGGINSTLQVRFLRPL